MCKGVQSVRSAQKCARLRKGVQGAQRDTRLELQVPHSLQELEGAELHLTKGKSFAWNCNPPHSLQELEGARLHSTKEKRLCLLTYMAFMLASLVQTPCSNKSLSNIYGKLVHALAKTSACTRFFFYFIKIASS